MTAKKMMITSKSDLNNLKKIVTNKCLHEKFIVSMKVVAEVTAEEGMMNLYFEDSRMLTTDEIFDLKSRRVL